MWIPTHSNDHCMAAVVVLPLDPVIISDIPHANASERKLPARMTALGKNMITFVPWRCDHRNMFLGSNGLSGYSRERVGTSGRWWREARGKDQEIQGRGRKRRVGNQFQANRLLCEHPGSRIRGAYEIQVLAYSKRDYLE